MLRQTLPTVGLIALALAVPVDAQAGPVPTALMHLRTHGVVVTNGFHDRIPRPPSPRARSAAASGTDLTLTTAGWPIGPGHDL